MELAGHAAVERDLSVEDAPASLSLVLRRDEAGGPLPFADDQCPVAEIAPGRDGLCHVSELDSKYVQRPEDVVQIGDKVFLGGNAAVHQFVRIGEGAMIGGVSGITRDVIPFGFAFGPRADLVGLNVIGLKRRGYSREEIHRLRRAYLALFEGAGSFDERVKLVAAEFSGDALVGKVMAFVEASGSRSIMKTASGGGAGGDMP